MLDLYALCDGDLLRRYQMELEDFIDAAKLFKAKIVQYRDKNASLDEKRENLQRLRTYWDGVLIVNDEVSLAPLCDGLHIGQEDLEVAMKRLGTKSKNQTIKAIRQRGAKIVGLSTHSLEEVQEANDFALDYIGLGAYRASTTKDVRYVLGRKLFEIAKASRHKVVAIGGVRLFEHLPNVWLKAVGSDLCIKALTYA